MRHAHWPITLATLLVVGLLSAIVYAQAAPTASPPPLDPALVWPILGVGLATGWGYGARYLTATRWVAMHSVLGHLVITLVGTLIAGAEPVFQSGHVTLGALELAGLGAFTTFLAGLNHPPPSNGSTAVQAAELALRSGRSSGRASLLVLMALALVAFAGAIAMAGCHGYKAPTYATLAVMAQGAAEAAPQVPPICEGQENAAVDGAKTKADALAVTSAIHARCAMALAGLAGAGQALKAARDAVHDAPEGADMSAIAPWIAAAVHTYCDLAPLIGALSPGLKLPIPPGVC